MTNESYPVRCPSCQSEVNAPESGNMHQCKHCGQSFVVDPDKAAKTPKEEVAASVLQTDASQAQTAAPINETADETVNPDQAEAFALNGWKTSVGFSILGVVLAIAWMVVIGFIISAVVESALPNLSSYATTGIVGPINGLVYQIACILYALIVYPSYFKDKPLVKSNRAISCLNFLFGNVIFGALWNRSLTNRQKGSSYIVFAVLSVLAVCSIGFQLATTMPHYIAANEQLTSSSSNAATSEQAYTSNSNRVASYVNEDAGFAIDFESEPEVTYREGEGFNTETFTLPLGNGSDGLTYKESVRVDYAAVPFYETEEEEHDFLSGVLSSEVNGRFGITPDPSYVRYGKVNDNPAISYNLRGNNGYIGFAIVHSSERIYCIYAATESENDLRRFIDSFTLL